MNYVLKAYPCQYKLIYISGQMVMFTAIATSNQAVRNGNKFVFNNVLLNTGGGYSGSTSQFTCVVAGHYLFSITLMSQGGKDVVGRIVSSTGEDICPEVWADDPSATSQLENSASGTCMVHCAQGQKVWVKSVYNTSGLYGGKRSSFVGTLIRSEP